MGSARVRLSGARVSAYERKRPTFKNSLNSPPSGDELGHLSSELAT